MTIEQYYPKPFALVVQWQNLDHEVALPAATYQDALELHAKVSLRPDMMRRVLVRGHGQEWPLWDIEWPQATAADLLNFPDDTPADWVYQLLQCIRTAELRRQTINQL